MAASNTESDTLHRTFKVRNLHSIVLKLYRVYHEDMLAQTGDVATNTILNPDLVKLSYATAELRAPKLLDEKIQNSITKLFSDLKEFRKKRLSIEVAFKALLNAFAVWEAHEEKVVMNKYKS